MLKWLFGNRSKAEEKPAAPAPEQKAAVPASPVKKDYAIYRGPAGVVAAIKTAYSEHLALPGPDGRPLMKDGRPVTLKTSGAVFNTTTLSGFIVSMERNGYDMSHHKEILEELKTATANAGLTEQMAKIRLSGYLIGEPETGNVILRDPVPVDLKGHRVTCIYPDIERKGYSRAFTFTVS